MKYFHLRHVALKFKQESRDIARKPRDAVRFGLMFADIHYKFKSSQAPKARFLSSIHTSEKKQNLTKMVI